MNNYQVGPTVLLHVTEYKFVFCRIVTVYYLISISVSEIIKRKNVKQINFYTQCIDNCNVKLLMIIVHVYIRWCSFRLTVTRRVSVVEQELLSLPKNMSLTPVFSGVCVGRSLVFCVVFCRSLLVFLAIVVSVILFTASDCPLVISNILFYRFRFY